MKRTLLALAIASATYSLPTVAAEEEMLSEGVRLQTIDKAHSVAKIPLNERTWSFSGVPVDVDLSDIEMTGDPREIARAAILKIRHLGYLDRYVSVNTDENIINIKQAEVHRQGPFEDYLPVDLTAQALSKRLPLIHRAADAYNSTPKIDIGQIEQGQVTVNAVLNEKTKRFNSGFTLSSFGSRYAGTDTASIFTYGSPVDGLLTKASYSYGLSDWRSESKGGGYQGISLGLEHPEPFGIFAMDYRFSDSKQGGDFVALDMTQQVHILDAQYIYPTTWGEWFAGYRFVDQSMEMAAIDLESSQRYNALFAGAQQKFTFNTTNPKRMATVTVDHRVLTGLDQKTDGILFGTPADDHWVKYEGDVDYEQTLGAWSLNVGGGIQLSDTDNLPNHEEFYLGGPERGNAYYPGVASTQQGMYAFARLYSPVFSVGDDGMFSVSLRPYVGYNYSTGENILMDDWQQAQSIELGAKIQVAKQVIGEIGFSTAVSNEFNVDYDNRFMFNINYLF